MGDWLLIISMTLKLVGGGMSTYKVETIDGFTSRERCEAAASAIGKKVRNQAVNHVAAMGMRLDDSTQLPIVFSDCIRVEK